MATIQRWLPAVTVTEAAATGAADGRIQVRAKAGLEDLIPEYLSNRKRDLGALADAVKRGNLPAAKVIGHGMKGSGTGYGFPAFTELGRGIEQCAVAQDAVGLSRLITELDEYLTRLEVVY